VLARRVHAIDVVRGVVMVLMALDHVRVYSGVPAGGPEPAVFLTRWITNFCAPAFFLLTGTSAWLKGRSIGRAALARWLVTRGLLLVALELTYLRLAWTFNFDYAHYTIAGVIWALGWSMVLLGALAGLPAGALAVIGLVQIEGHNLIRPLLGNGAEALLNGPFGPLLRILYFGGAFPIGGSHEPNFFVLYSIVPWFGVTCLGYAMGRIFERALPARSGTLVVTGLACTLAFVLLRAFQLYGDRPWLPPGQQPWAAGWIMFLATTKYPASLQFLLMTLGPTFVALGLLENARGRNIADVAVIGRVPLFFYLLHIPLIHLVAIMVALVRTPHVVGWLFANHPVNPPEAPEGYRWPLGLVYGVTACVLVALYYPCRWYAKVRAERPWGWTRYI